VTDNSAALTRLGETLRAKQQQSSGLNTKQINWLTDGYNLGYLDADETKARFNQLIDELERKKGAQ
jgi:hypothetical protein